MRESRNSRIDKIRLQDYRNRLSSTILCDIGDNLYKKKGFTRSGAVEYVLLPVLLTFTKWVLEQAQKDKIRKLYFLARDGFPAYKIAKKLCEADKIPIQCQYLYCSRYSLRVPMYSENISESLDQICRSSIDVTMNKIMRRAGLSADEIETMKEVLPDVNFDSRIAYSDLGRYRELLRKNKTFIELLNSSSYSRWPALKAYFAQEGLLENNRIGIVDSGWTGSTQKSMNDIRRRCGCKNKVIGYYFGLYETPCHSGIKEYRTFYFDPNHEFMNKLLFSNCLFEALFSADHGSASGYLMGDTVEPVLENHDTGFTNSDILRAADEYSDDYIHTRDINRRFPDDNTEKNRKLLQKSLRIFMWNPTCTEADYFGRFLFSDDLLDRERKEVAPDFPESYLKENHVINRLLVSAGIRKKQIHESAWFEASSIRNGKRSLYHRLSFLCYKSLSFMWHDKRNRRKAHYARKG